MSLKFLSKDEAIQLINNSSYFDTFNINELMIRTNGKGRLYYLENVIEFNKSDKVVLVQLFNMVFNLMKQKINSLFPTCPIYLIKMKSGVDWDYPFTIENAIVLTEKVINQYINCSQQLQIDYQQKSGYHRNLVRPTIEPILSNACTLFHEVLHIVQRKPTKKQYDIIYNIYKEWGFSRIMPTDLKFNEKLSYVPISNPDGYNFNYLVKVRSTINVNSFQLFLPTLIYSQEAKRPRGILIEVIPDVDNKFLITNNFNYIEAYQQYTDMFRDVHQCLYHPNEIFATVISQWVVQNTVYDKLLPTYNLF